MSELVGDRRDIAELTCEVQEDERLFSLAIARKSSSTLPCPWEYIDTFLFDHPLRVVVEVSVKILHHAEMEIIRLFERKVLV
jgi:hypothetical protein